MSYKILRELVEAYSPSGFEDSVQKIIYKNYKTTDNHFVVDNRGAMTAIYNENNDYKVMLIAHADEISLVVNGYNEDGTLKVDSNGVSIFVFKMVSPSVPVLPCHTSY